ncbi:hypothetical protein M1P97_12915 [Parabacteroides sp. GYB001]|uniref:hypothetical protein n=1 Tax=Parabacteroides leei TaxID=2939491 RepID=UPI002016DA28|nr:hypothetical protein [Parabacteroides leei]MCL3852189.1 hypothetical protein [Parabacteroides leei]
MGTIIADGKELDSFENMDLLVYYSLCALEAIKSVHQYLDISVDNQRNAIDLALYFMSHDPECIIMDIEVSLQSIRLIKRKSNQIPLRRIIISC